MDKQYNVSDINFSGERIILSVDEETYEILIAQELDQAVTTFINSLNKEDVSGYFIEADARATLI